MAKYKLTNSEVQNTETGEFIPNAPGNIDWREYLVWAETNTADPQYTAQEIEDGAWATNGAVSTARQIFFHATASAEV